jgi:SPP1 gp7 family putative phage head morphogenesis protein
VAWGVTATVKRFNEAVDWFRQKVPMSAQAFETLEREARDQAFTIAAGNELTIVQQLHDEIARSLESGESYDEFKKRVKARLKGDWTKAQSARLETVYRTNVQGAYNTGRWYQMKDPAVVALRPFWMFDGVQDSRQSDICRELDPPGGPPTILRHDDPFVYANQCPRHHRCRSQWVTLSPESAAERGYNPDRPPPNSTPAEGFGMAPPLRGKWKPDPADYSDDLFQVYEARLAELAAL